MAERVMHDEWCDANGCRCGKCPCLGIPWCVAMPDEPTTPHADDRNEAGNE